MNRVRPPCSTRTIRQIVEKNTKLNVKTQNLFTISGRALFFFLFSNIVSFFCGIPRIIHSVMNMLCIEISQTYRHCSVADCNGKISMKQWNTIAIYLIGIVVVTVVLNNTHTHKKGEEEFSDRCLTPKITIDRNVLLICVLANKNEAYLMLLLTSG